MKKVLVAHRGELARRIIASCHAYGIEAVAVYTQEEKDCAFITAADEAYELSGIGAAAYMNAQELITLAKKSQSEAIHPGYGFLSESAPFAQAVIDAGLIWIGPSPESIRIMGDKVAARQLAKNTGIPIIPGSFFSTSDDGLKEALAFSLRIGLPVIIKNPQGGGGKAIKQVSCAEDFLSAWHAVHAESRLLPTTPYYLIEKYLTSGRHIEIQLLGDGKTIVHAYERECSIQRKHQKIIEEAPCLFISQEIKELLYSHAINLGKQVFYEGLGTVEFLVCDNNIYFLEMNTRLQVEHSVTEMITGIDLVYEQLLIAFEKKLSRTQAEIKIRGHAVQARIYAEEPFQNYRPSAGKIVGIEFPVLPFVRIDHDLFPGFEISPFFDPMIAKLSAYGQTRALALKYLLGGLRQSNIAGIFCNKKFLELLLNHEVVLEGKLSTKLLDDQCFFESLYKKYEQSKEKVTGAFLAECHSLLAPLKKTPLRAQQSPQDQPLKRDKKNSRWREQLWNR